MPNVNIFHNALSFNTKESGEGGGGLSIHVNGDTGEGETDRLSDFLLGNLEGEIVLTEWPSYKDQYNAEKRGLYEDQFQNQKYLEEITLPVSIVNTGTYFGTRCFQRCTSLKKVNNIPKNLSIIPDYCFSRTGIEEIDLPEGLKSLGNSAFEYCANLKHIQLPSTITSYGNGVFDNSGLIELDISPFASNLSSGSLWIHTMRNLESLNINGYKGTIKYLAYLPKLDKLIIPTSITRIGVDDTTKPFNGTKIKNGLYLPSTIVSITRTAFSGLDSDIYCDFAEGKISGAPWGINSSRIHYNVPLPDVE